jgi:hypothetical protein
MAKRRRETPSRAAAFVKLRSLAKRGRRALDTARAECLPCPNRLQKALCFDDMFLGIFIVLPLINVFAQDFAERRRTRNLSAGVCASSGTLQMCCSGRFAGSKVSIVTAAVAHPIDTASLSDS